MVWEYLAILRRIIQKLNSISDEKERRQSIALCIVMAVTVVETFLNIFFRLKVKEPNFISHERYLLDCLSNRKSLEFKIKNWPKSILGLTIDLTTGIGKRFSDLKDKRNELMHFTISDEPVIIENIQLRNFSDLSSYHSLQDSDAYGAVATAEDFIQAILELSGVSDSKLNGRMLFWTGRPPNQALPKKEAERPSVRQRET